MYEEQPQGLLADLITTFRDAGGKIDYVLIGGISSDQSSDSYALHKECAVFTVEATVVRYPQIPAKGLASRREPEKIQGEKVDPENFFAPGHIWIPIEEIASFPLFTPEEVLMYQEDWNVQVHHGLEYAFLNYHYAFCDPPYGLMTSDRCRALDKQDAERLFSAINDELFGNEREGLTIYSWSTDWAEYFDEGHEWWGSFLWTVYSPQTERLVGIAASTSD